MKRLLLSMFLVACFFASCKNEDIPVTRDVTFNVNPYTIVSDFARHEINTGDLVGFGCSTNPEYYKLRTYLLVYNLEGLLVESQIADLNDFNDNMVATINLSDGNYTVVTIAHIVDKQNDIPFWRVDGVGRLDALTIADNDEYNDFWMKLLGVDGKRIEVGSGNNVYDVNVKTVGSLMINYFRNIHHFPNYVYYQMFMDKKPNKITFGNDGSFNASNFVSTSLSYPSSDVLRPVNYSQEDVYWYSFFTSMGSTRFEWHAWDKVGGVQVLGGSRNANIQEGQVFLSTIDLKAGIFEIVELNN